jgi:thiol-disulfide isomerase/thioredoxin
MRKTNLLMMAMVLTLIFVASVALGEVSPPAVGNALPEITLVSPANTDQRAYLGLSQEGPFTLQELTAPVIIVEIFSMYCPYCQAEAPRVNDLYYTTQKDPQLSGKVVIIGIGAGNTPFEVDIFRNKYQVPFPMFDDEDYAIHQIIGKVRTPYFIVAKSKKGSAREVTYSKAGGLEDLDGFLEMLRRAARGD